MAAEWARHDEESARLYADLVRRSAAGPQGDDVFVTYAPASLRVRLLADERCPTWLALGGVLVAWLVGARPLAPRHPRWPIEAWRVALLASAPSVVLAWTGLRVVERLGPAPGSALIVPQETACVSTAALVGVLLAAAARAARPRAVPRRKQLGAREP